MDRAGESGASYERRLRRWDVKFKSDWAKQLVDEQRERMRMNAETRFRQLTRFEGMAKGVLGRYVVPSSSVSNYLCFVRELWKLNRKFTGLLLRGAAQERLEKWEGRGLDPEVLSDLAFFVFSIAIADRWPDRPARR